MKFLALAISLLFTTAFAVASPSYPELAASSLKNSWEELQEEATVLKQPGFQPHETKDLRKRIGALREMMDLFVYSYWKTGKQDPWLEIRDFLDQGYELVGSYKDLYDIQNLESPEQAVYDEEEVLPLRREIQNWWLRWSYSAKDVHGYLTNPSQTRIYKRKKADLSRFYWGASELVPAFGNSGEENLAVLCRDLLHTALSDWPTVKKIKTPASSLEKENQFHDFRKRLRSVARILRTFPGVYQGTEENLRHLEDLSTLYGSINDKITAAHRAEKRGKKKRLEKLHEQIKEEWKELVQLQKDRDIESLLERTLSFIK